MQDVLFEISSVPIIMDIKRFRMDIIAIIALTIATITYLRRRNKDKKNGKVEKDNASLIMLIILDVVILWMCIGVHTEYVHLKEAYENGTCLYVEGEIHDYKSHPGIPEWNEEFMVEDERFFYSYYEVTAAYNWPKHYGGVIKGDGQRVKIGYVFDDKSNKTPKNKIVYIEQL